MNHEEKLILCNHKGLILSFTKNLEKILPPYILEYDKKFFIF